MGSYSLLQGVFLTQGSNTGLWHCRQILYCLSTREAHHVSHLDVYKKENLNEQNKLTKVVLKCLYIHILILIIDVLVFPDNFVLCACKNPTLMMQHCLKEYPTIVSKSFFQVADNVGQCFCIWTGDDNYLLTATSVADVK